MCTMASQITSLTIVYSTIHSSTDERKHQSSASLAFVMGIHRWPVNSPHKGPVTRKMFPFDDIIMTQSRGFESSRGVSSVGILNREPVENSGKSVWTEINQASRMFISWWHQDILKAFRITDLLARNFPHQMPVMPCCIFYLLLARTSCWINNWVAMKPWRSCDILLWTPTALTHWGRVTHICIGNLTIIGSDNGLSPGRRQAIN